MPPKKAPKKSKSDKEDATGGSKEALEKGAMTVEVYKRDLELQKELNEKLKLEVKEARQITAQMHELLEQKNADRIELMADMNRQYKTMETDLNGQIALLEKKLADLQAKLATTEANLSQSEAKFKKTVADKDATIEELNAKLTHLGVEFERMLSETVNRMSYRLEEMSKKWSETDGLTLSEETQKKLADFHLTRLAM